MNAFKALSIKYGGPHRYLQQRDGFAEEQKLEVCRPLWWSALPLATSVEYTHSKNSLPS